MISTDFAPNESGDDALISLITLFLPHRWKSGKETNLCIKELNSIFPYGKIAFFLSARSGLFFLLKSLHISQDSQVAVTGFTCEAVVLPVQANSLHPLYIDIEKETYSMEYEDLVKKITAQTKVIILQHTFGLIPKNRDRVLQLAKEKGLFVIEDLAHGFTPSFWQKEILSDKQSLLLSFGRSKALSSVFGGAIVTNEIKLNNAISQIEAKLPYPSNGILFQLLCYKPLSVLIKKTYNLLYFGKLIHKIVKSLGLLIAEISPVEKRGVYDSYLEKKYPNALAKLLLHQLKKYPAVIGNRHETINIYNVKFKLAYKTPMARYPVLLENKNTTLNDVSKKNIFLGNWYTQPVAPVGLKLDAVEYTMGSCPTAEFICKNIVNLPTLVSKDEAVKILEYL